MEQGLQIVSESKEIEEDKNWWKIVLIGLFDVGVSVLSFWYLNQFLSVAGFSNFWLLVLFFFLALVFNILTVFLVKRLWKAVLIGFLEIAVSIVWYAKNFSAEDPNLSRILVLGLAAGFYFLFLGLRRGNKMIENSLKTKFFGTSRRMIPMLSAGFLVPFMVVFGLYFFGWHAGSPAMGRGITDGLIDAIVPFSSIITPGNTVSRGESMKELLRNFALQKLQSTKISTIDKSQTINVSYNSLPPDYQKQLLDQMTGELEAGLKSKFSYFDSRKSVADFAYEAASDYFNKLTIVFGSSAPVLLVAVLFFIIKGTLVLFYWLIEFIAFVVLKILVVFNFAYPNLETRTREFLLLS